MAKADSDQLVDEIELIRDRLADTVDALIDRTNPRTMVRRSLTNAKARFVEPDGSPKIGTIAPIAGGVVAVVVAITILRRLLR